MTELDVLAAINGALQKEFKGGMKIYGREVSDGYKKPSLFTEVVTSGMNIGTQCYAKMQCNGRITLFEAQPDSVTQLQTYNRVRKAIGRSLEVGQRKLTVHGFSTQYTGERNNILQINVDLGEIVLWIREEVEGYSAMENINVEIKEES